MPCLTAYVFPTAYDFAPHVCHQETARLVEYANRWMNLSAVAKRKIKNDTLMTLGSSSQKVGPFASQVVAAIAAVELPLNQWGDLLKILQGFVNTQANLNLHIATLRKIGFICESIVPQLTACSRTVLTMCRNPKS